MHHKNVRRIGFIRHDRIEDLLRPLISDPQDREFVLRCLLEEGPEHHRGANYILLALLGELSMGAQTPAEDGAPVPMRLPPHLRQSDTGSTYPIKLPTGVLERLAARGSREMAHMVDCLTDGPPQHSLSNVVMLCLLDALLNKDRVI